MNAAVIAVLGLVVGAVGALLVGIARSGWAKPAGVALLVAGVLAEAVAVQAGPHRSNAADASFGLPGATPGITLGTSPSAPVTSPPTTGATSSPLPLPSVFHPHLLYALRYASGSSAVDPRDLNREWVRLTSPLSRSITLTGWTLRNGAGAIYRFPPFVLGAKATVTIHTGPGHDDSTSLYWGRTAYAWPDAEGTVTLTDASGIVQNTCHYRHFAGPSPVSQASC